MVTKIRRKRRSLSIDVRTHGFLRSGVRRAALALLACSWLGITWAQGLPPKDEMQRLMLATEKAVTQQRWDDAARYLTQLQSLKVDKPVDYLFLRGEIMYHDKQYDEARSALNDYVVKAGEKASHYSKALELITAVDEAQREQSAQPARKSVATIKPAGSDEIKRLEKLYLTDSPREALITYLNSQLDLHAWRGAGKVIHLDARRGVRYRLTVGKDGRLRVRTTRFKANGESVVTISSVDVFGINPMVTDECDDVQHSCWIHDPRDGSRWLRLGPDQGAADDIARALTNLIRVMQRS